MSSGTLRDAVGMLLAIIITLGFWFGPDFWRLWTHEPEHAVPAVTRDARPASPPAPVPAPDTTETAPVKLEAPRHARALDDNAEELARRAQTCAFWSARADDAAGRIYRDRACREMRRYAAATGQRVPAVDARGEAPRIEPSPRSRPRAVQANECTRYDYGSIRYRQCRANESQRLRTMCQFHRQRDEWPDAGRWCAAYESYSIVD